MILSPCLSNFQAMLRAGRNQKSTNISTRSKQIHKGGMMSKKQAYELADFKRDFLTLTELEQKQAKENQAIERKIIQLRANHTEKNAEDIAQIVSLRKTLTHFAEQRRADFITGGKKYFPIGGGLVKWRKKPDKVAVIGEIEEILETLKKRRLSRFIRVKEELDKTQISAIKEAVKKYPIDGLEIQEGEEVVILETGVKL